MLPKVSGRRQEIASISGFLAGLGHLHDARITELRYSPNENELTLYLDDLYSNFIGLPEYPGETPACLAASGILALNVDLQNLMEDLPWIIQFYVHSLEAGSLFQGKIICVEGAVSFTCASFAAWQT